MKKLKLAGIALTAALAFATGAYAQEEVAVEETTAEAANDTVAKPGYEAYAKKGAIAFNVATVGFGAEYAHNINRHLNVRVRANILDIKDYGHSMDFSGQQVNILANVSVLNFDLLLEYHPFASSFKLIGGASYVSSALAQANVTLNNTFEYGDIVIANEDIGEMDFTVDYSGLAPYAGLGFGRAVPKKRVGFGFEVGTYYVGAPSVTILSTGMLEETGEVEGPKLEENLSEYAWLPFVNFRVAFRLQ